MQPQGHMQLTIDMVAGGLDPQAAIDQPRFCIPDGTKEGAVALEGGIEDEAIEGLKSRGHQVSTNVVGYKRSVFGRAQIIKRDRTNGVLWAGSDGRADGCAMGY
jgi:gamma-glutamyltranspeptidase/glutathione hydrolase